MSKELPSKEQRTTPGEHGHLTTADRDACPVCNPTSNRKLHRCPDCKNQFVQPFVCTTCGAEKLYDETVRSQAATIERLRNTTAVLKTVYRLAGGHSIECQCRQCEIFELLEPIVGNTSQRNADETPALPTQMLLDAVNRLTEVLHESDHIHLATLWTELQRLRVGSSEEPTGSRTSEEAILRGLLAAAYSGSNLYCDDGELQDGADIPVIDYLRDSVLEIERKIRERGRRKLASSQEKATAKRWCPSSLHQLGADETCDCVVQP
jgi:hypothetical protein